MPSRTHRRAHPRRADGPPARHARGCEALEARTLLASAPLPAPAAEVRANTFTRDHQRSPSIAVDADGDYVVTWESYQQEELDWNVYAQRFAADGTPRGVEFRVNQDTSSYHTDSSVASDAAGNFVVTWTQGPWANVYSRRYDADGKPNGDAFIVDWSANAGTSSVAMNARGEFVVVWDITSEADDRRSVFGQAYLANGVYGGVFQVDTNLTGSAWKPDVAIESDGDFTVAYEVDDAAIASTYVRRFGRLGRSSEAPVLVTAVPEAGSAPSVAAGDDGSFVVAWGVPGAVYARRYNALSLPRGADILVGTLASKPAPPVDLAADASGNFLVSWSAADAAGQSDVFARGYASDGSAVGASFRLNSYIASQQTSPSAALRADGGFVAAWNSWGQDGSLTGVYVRRFGNTAPPASAVVGRRVYYANSVFDGAGGLPGAADDSAIASNKFALQPGGAPTFLNVTSYTKGINGVMVDVADLPEGVRLTSSDFAFRSGATADASTWTAGPTPAIVATRTIAPGRTRVTLMWRDYDPRVETDLPRAVVNGWLEVTMKANARTGLAAPDVFYFGNLVGETGANDAGAIGVTAVDVVRVRAAQAPGVTLSSLYDFNRDGRVNAFDLAAARAHAGFALPLPVVPKLTLSTASVQAAGGDAVSTRKSYVTSLLV